MCRHRAQPLCHAVTIQAVALLCLLLKPTPTHMSPLLRHCGWMSVVALEACRCRRRWMALRINPWHCSRNSGKPRSTLDRHCVLGGGGGQRPVVQYAECSVWSSCFGPVSPLVLDLKGPPRYGAPLLCTPSRCQEALSGGSDDDKTML